MKQKFKKEPYKVHYFKLAFRNLGRHKVKTIVTCCALAVGLMAYMYMDAMMKGMNIGSKRNYVNYETGSVKIYSKEYYKRKDVMPLHEGFYDYEDILAKLNENGFDGAPHAMFNGSLASKKNNIPFLFAGIEPERERAVFHYDDYVVEGDFFEKDTEGIVIGVNGADNLKVGVGDIVNMSTIIDLKDDFGELRHIYQSMEFTIIGIITTPNPKINGNYVMVPLDMLQDETGMMLDGMVTEICIRKKGVPDHALPDKTEAPEVISEILGATLPDDLTVVSWMEDAKEFIAIMESKTGFSSIIILLLAIIAVIGVANTMLMAIYERTKEIGMLRSLGMTDRSLLRLFMVEAGMIGFIGSLIGVILGMLANIPMVLYGLDYTRMMQQSGDMGFRITGIFKSTWNFDSAVFAVILMTLITAITAIFPVRRGLKQSIADAMRFE